MTVSYILPAKMSSLFLPGYLPTRIAAKKAALLATVTEKRVMPPWKAEPGYGSFANERRLSEQREWAEAGAPEGAAKDKPPLPVFPNGWEAGQPDKVLTMATSSKCLPTAPTNTAASSCRSLPQRTFT
jgi:hypothetical protein